MQVGRDSPRSYYIYIYIYKCIPTYLVVYTTVA